MAEQLFSGFSGALETLNEDFMRALATISTQSSVDLFLERYNDQFSDASELATYLRGWSTSLTAFEHVWDQALGAANHCLVNSDISNAPTVAASVAIALASKRVLGNWKITLDEPLQPLWGNLLLPPTRKLSVRTETAQAILETDWDRFELTWDGNSWHSDNAVRLPEIEREGRQIVLLPREAIESRFPARELVEHLYSAEELASAIPVLEQALDLIATYAPPFQTWVMRLVNSISLLRYETGLYHSGSSPHLPGFIYLSMGSDPLVTAELLVHEATHQYMNLLCRLGPLDDGSDEQLYYSPFKDTHRPLSAIITAYHAFGNILLFYALCGKSNEARRADIEKCIARFTPQVAEIEPIMVDNKAITDVGNALWHPLSKQLRLFNVLTLTSPEHERALT